MVGITIGLLVVLAAIGTFVFTRTSSSVGSDAFNLHQQAQHIFQTVGAHAKQAGAYAVVSRATPAGHVSFQGGTETATRAIDGTDGGGATSDTLIIRHSSLLSLPPHLPNGAGAVTLPNCLGDLGAGAGPAAGGIILSTFARNAGTNELTCNPGTGPVAIADNVEDFQVRYGIRNPAGTLVYNDAFPANDPRWARVQSLEICLQLRGRLTNNPQIGGVPDCRNVAVAADGRLRRVFRQVIMVRVQQESTI